MGAPWESAGRCGRCGRAFDDHKLPKDPMKALPVCPPPEIPRKQ